MYECDQIGRFWNFLQTFFAKVAQMFGYSLGSCGNHFFLSQNDKATFWAHFGRTWETFISTSDHTGTCIQLILVLSLSRGSGIRSHALWGKSVCRRCKVTGMRRHVKSPFAHWLEFTNSTH